MKRIKNYQEFTNEELNWKQGLAGAALAIGLNLTSCDTKNEMENKIPQVEILVQNQLDRMNDYQDEGDTVILNKTEIKGPFNIENLRQNGKIVDDPFNTYYIVCDISTFTSASKKNGFYVMVYSENKETGNGNIVATKSFDNKKDLEENIDFYKKYYKWKRNINDYLNEVDELELHLKSPGKLMSYYSGEIISPEEDIEETKKRIDELLLSLEFGVKSGEITTEDLKTIKSKIDGLKKYN